MPRFARRVSTSLLLLAALAGCSASSVPIHGNDGRPYLYVDCSGMFRSLETCYEAANQLCPSGYRIMSAVAPRTNPFGSLVIDCTPGAASDAAPVAAAKTAATP